MNDVTTSLKVAQSLLSGIDFTPERAEAEFGRAYRIFFDLYNAAAESVTRPSDAYETAEYIAHFARSVLQEELTLEQALIAVRQAAGQVVGSLPEGDSEGDNDALAPLIFRSESALLSSSLRVRKAIEQLPLGQEVDVATEYVLTLISDKAHSYAVARSQGLTEADGYRIFINTVPVATDIAIDSWGRLGSTYYNPSSATLSLSFIKAQMVDLEKYVRAYDLGLGSKLDDILAQTAQFIFDMADREGQRYDSLSNSDRQGVSLGIALHLLGLTQRAWRLCINNLINEVDDLLTNEEKGLEWLESDKAPIDIQGLFAAIQKLYSSSDGFSFDADIDLESLDAVVNQEFALTAQAADAMIEEMSPWSMS
ncbi:hypothetical protein [Marinobacter shengliensis]|uniref:hypothetical protein n=1 Tax=Marinobacter shengliensis TaxID=1389223 RepID=UPI0011087673|nr:hypothetical protein [Marinobacter shengliensis]